MLYRFQHGYLPSLNPHGNGMPLFSALNHRYSGLELVPPVYSKFLQGEATEKVLLMISSGNYTKSLSRPAATLGFTQHYVNRSRNGQIADLNNISMARYLYLPDGCTTSRVSEILPVWWIQYIKIASFPAHKINASV